MKKLYVLIITILFSISSAFAENIVVVATGGTIAGVGDSSSQPAGYKAASLGVDKILESVPELKNIRNVKISSEQVLQIASQDYTNEDWLKLGNSVNDILKSADGVVITHGTDTLEETAFFLSLVLKTDKPVVLVGAMRPATAISADGPMNLYNAVLVANSPHAKNRGVMVVMSDGIYDARNVVKSHNFKTDAFTSTTGPIGFIHNSEVVFTAKTEKAHTLESEFNITDIKSLPTVDILFGSAGAPTRYIEKAKEDKVDALVYAGVGNGSMSKSVEKAMRMARKDGIIIVRSSRIINGDVPRNSEVNDEKNDFIASYDLSAQKARILIMLGLTKSKDTEYLQSLFNKY